MNIVNRMIEGIVIGLATYYGMQLMFEFLRACR